MDNQQITLLSTLFNKSLVAILILNLKTKKFILFNKKALELYNCSLNSSSRIQKNRNGKTVQETILSKQK